MLIVRYILVTILGYLIGSFPTGYLVARFWKGVDPREGGSGRTGGTNVLRTAGKWAGLATGIGDVIKGATAMYVGRTLLNTDPAMVLTGLATVLGHNRSIFLGFRGGAGTSANIGVLLGWTPLAVPFVLAAGILTAVLTHMASVASIAAAIAMVVALVVLFFLSYARIAHVIYAVLACAIILWELRPNIQRLREGRERRVDHL